MSHAVYGFVNLARCRADIVAAATTYSATKRPSVSKRSDLAQRPDSPLLVGVVCVPARAVGNGESVAGVLSAGEPAAADALRGALVVGFVHEVAAVALEAEGVLCACGRCVSVLGSGFGGENNVWISAEGFSFFFLFTRSSERLGRKKGGEFCLRQVPDVWQATQQSYAVAALA